MVRAECRTPADSLAAALEISVGDIRLKTGWIDDGHLRDFDGALTTPLLDGRSTDEAMSSAIQDLSAMLDALVTGRARLPEAARVMEQAEQTISSLLRAIHLPPEGGQCRWLRSWLVRAGLLVAPNGGDRHDQANQR